jgi:hypothetical protein
MDQKTNWGTFTITYLIVNIIRMAYKGFKTTSQFGFLFLTVKVQLDSRHIHTVAVFLTVYQEHFPYSSADIYTSII